jgi:hypothetical protein
MVGCERDGTEHALLELIEPDEPRRLFLADLPSPLRAAARRIACTSGAAAAPRKSYTSSSSSFLSCASVGLTPSERMIVPISLQ